MSQINLPHDWQIIHEINDLFTGSIIVGSLADFLIICKDYSVNWLLKDIDIKITQSDFIKFYFSHEKFINTESIKTEDINLRLVSKHPVMSIYAGLYKQKPLEIFIMNEKKYDFQIINGLRVEHIDSRMHVVNIWGRKNSLLSKSKKLI